MLKIENNVVMGDGMSYLNTPNAGRDEIKPKYIFLHGRADTEDGIRDDFTTTDGLVKESAHILVKPDGSLLQFAPLNVKTWHAGVSYWQGHHGLNSCAIGIIILQPTGSFTDAQFEIMHELLPLIVAEYNIRDIVNEKEASPKRLRGPSFPTFEYKTYVDYGNADSAGRFIVTSPAPLAVRGGPDVHFEVFDRVQAGEGVKVLRYSVDNNWAFILYERADHKPKQGWVHESFLRRL